MSNDQVPEAPSREAQLAVLHSELLGHGAFGRVRGTLHKSVASLVDSCLGPIYSPTKVLANWDQRAGDIRIMVNLLAKFERDRMFFARDELQRALCKPGYMIAGETVPLEQTMPFTIFMIDPVMVIELCRWLKTANAADSLDENWPTLLKPETQSRLSDSMQGVVRAIGSFRLPDTPNYNQMWLDMNGARVWWGNRHREYNDWIWISSNVFDGLQHIAYKWKGPGPSILSPRIPHPYISEPGWITEDRFSLARAAPRDQAAVLSAFPRDVQYRVGTWQFHVPTAMKFGSRKKHFTVALHPEAEHARWQKERPVFASRGVSHGFGAVIVPNADAEHVFPASAERVLLRSVPRS